MKTLPAQATPAALNIKKAFRMYMTGTYPSKTLLLECALAAGIVVSQKALLWKNQMALRNQKFWPDLKRRVDEALTRAVIAHFRATGELAVGKEIYHEEFICVVTAVRDDGYTTKKGKSHAHAVRSPLYHLPFDMSTLPGDDPEGEEWWAQRKLAKAAITAANAE